MKRSKDKETDRAILHIKKNATASLCTVQVLQLYLANCLSHVLVHHPFTNLCPVLTMTIVNQIKRDNDRQTEHSRRDRPTDCHPSHKEKRNCFLCVLPNSGCCTLPTVAMCSCKSPVHQHTAVVLAYYHI